MRFEYLLFNLNFFPISSFLATGNSSTKYVATISALLSDCFWVAQG